jgi:hypothetical protein
MMQREPTLKLMVASKLHSAQQAAGLNTGQQQTEDSSALGRIPVQHQQPVLLQQQEGGSGIGGRAPGDSLQPASGQDSAVLNTWQDYKQQYIGKAGRRHTKPSARQRDSQQQQQEQASHDAAAVDADRQELPLPQSLQENLQQQQVTKEPTSAAAAAAAAGDGKAASAILQALQHTESKSQGAAQQQQQQQTSNGAAPAGAESRSNTEAKQRTGLTEADVAASMASAAGTVHAGLDPVDTTSSYIMLRGEPPTRLKYPLWWHGPMWSGSGYGGGEAGQLGRRSCVCQTVCGDCV